MVTVCVVNECRASAKEIVSSRRRAAKLERAMDMLRDETRKGVFYLDDLHSVAFLSGISERTIRTAKDALGLRDYYYRDGDGTKEAYWYDPKTHTPGEKRRKRRPPPRPMGVYETVYRYLLAGSVRVLKLYEDVMRAGFSIEEVAEATEILAVSEGQMRRLREGFLVTP